jgi:NTP pyrophosphatase (non-canonical NTP hydrolase)
VNESLIILAEECAEVSQAVAKLQRFGMYDPGNIRRLEEELGDVIALMLILSHHNYINDDQVMKRIPIKLEKLKQYSDIKDLDSIIENI